MLDRRLFTSMSYPADYGFIEGTLGEDGDPLDALVPRRRADLSRLPHPSPCRRRLPHDRREGAGREGDLRAALKDTAWMRVARHPRHPARAPRRDRALLPGLQGSRGEEGGHARLRQPLTRRRRSSTRPGERRLESGAARRDVERPVAWLPEEEAAAPAAHALARQEADAEDARARAAPRASRADRARARRARALPRARCSTSAGTAARRARRSTPGCATSSASAATRAPLALVGVGGLMLFRSALARRARRSAPGSPSRALGLMITLGSEHGGVRRRRCSAAGSRSCSATPARCSSA